MTANPLGFSVVTERGKEGRKEGRKAGKRKSDSRGMRDRNKQGERKTRQGEREKLEKYRGKAPLTLCVVHVSLCCCVLSATDGHAHFKVNLREREEEDEKAVEGED